MISGSGGFGGQRTPKAYSPKEAKDSLDSRQYGQVIDLISEGEIGGLVNGAQSIFIDNVPLQNPDGSYNFQNVTVYTRNGTQNQDYIPLQNATSTPRAVGVVVTQATPVVRTITNRAVDAVRVTINVPQLQIFTDKGDIGGEDAHVVILVQYNGGGYTQVVSDVIRGRTNDPYDRDYQFNLTGAFPVDIKVMRGNADSTSSKKVNAFSWSAYNEIVYDKLRYPNSALVALRFDAEQFNQIPSRSYLINGIKVRIPNNATVDPTTGRLIYAGVWGGTFAAAQWTTDPAWILYDLLIANRYGFGDHIQSPLLDKWAFYSASVYSSTLVPDGQGGYEPRFSCNVNIQTSEDAYKLINDMCSVFRAMPFWATGALTVSQDAPSDPAYLFNPSNVVDGIFNYSGGSLKNRPTVAVVSYLDLTLRDIAKEAVEDPDLIRKYGVTSTEVSAFACTSRSQARRIGRWLLYSEWHESEVVSFSVGIDAGVVVRPGQVVAIADPVRAGARRGGRISAATTTAITLDNATGIAYSAGAELSVVLPTGTAETRAVVSVAGSVVTVSPAFSAAPNANSVWIYETTNIQAQLWRVLTVEEQDGINYAITALQHDPGKYAYIEQNVPLPARDITDLNEIPAPPTNLSGVELLYEGTGGVKSKLLISWQGVQGVAQYRIRWRQQSGNWTVSTQERPDYEILDTTAGTYEIEVYSLNAALRSSTEPAQLSFNAYGKTAPPVDVSGLSLIAVDTASAILSWNRATDLDVLVGGKVLIRHSPALTGATWEGSQEIVAAAAGSQTQKLVPLLEGSYLVKFEDDTGNRSVAATIVVADLPTPQERLLVVTYAEDLESPPFSGNMLNLYYSPDLFGLTLAGSIAWDDYLPGTNFDDAPGTLDGTGGISSSGEYEFGSTYDMGAVFDVNLRRRLDIGPYVPSGLWDDQQGLFDDRAGLFDGAGSDLVDARVYVRTTTDNPSGTPTWSEWREFANAIVRGRGFQFKVVATTAAPDVNILISQLGAVMELQQRIEQSATLTSGAATYAVTFAAAFYQAPSIGITALDMQTGDYYTITGVTRSGFSVAFRNSAGTLVSRQFTYAAVGYGKEA
jgi:hypothetical protein